MAQVRRDLPGPSNTTNTGDIDLILGLPAGWSKYIGVHATSQQDGYVVGWVRRMKDDNPGHYRIRVLELQDDGSLKPAVKAEVNVLIQLVGTD